MNDPVAYYIKGLLRQPNASYARRYLGISDNTGGTSTVAGGGGVAISAGANSQSTGTVIFSNSNGLTFGLNAGTLTASHNGITSQSNQAASASNGSFAFQTLGFSNANNVTFGTSAGSIITASVAPPGAASVNFSAGTTSNNLDSVVFSNSNNATFGLNGSTITMSHEVSLNQVLDPSADARFLMATRQVHFQWGTNLSTFTTNAARQGLFEIDVIGGTGFATTSADRVDVVHIHQSTNNPYLHMLHIQADGTNATAIHVENSGAIGMEINRPISYDGGSVPMILGTSQSNLVSNLNAFYLEGARSSQFLTTQLAQAASASNGSFTFETLNFSNANNVTFGTSAGGIITASVNAAAGGSVAFSADVSSTFQTLTFQNSNNISFSNNAGALRITHNLAGTGTAVTGGASITLNSTGLSFNGTALAGTGTTFAGANISGSMTQNSAGLNLSLSVAAPGGGGVTLTGFDPFQNLMTMQQQNGAGSIFLNPIDFPAAVQFDRAALGISYSNATNSTGSVTISMYLGFYTKNVSTLSLLYSSSTAQGFTHSGNVRNSLMSGPRLMTMGWTSTITAGNYVVGIMSNTTSAGGNATLSQIVVSQNTTAYSGILGASSAASDQFKIGLGRFSVTSASLPNSIGITEITGTATSGFRQPIFMLLSRTA